MKMKSFLCVVWFCLCLTPPSSSSPAGISQTMTSILNRKAKNELGAVFNISGFLSLQLPKNFTPSSSVNFQISGFIDLVISPSERLGLRKPIADWDDALITEREPVFRKDYTLDEQKLGWYKLHQVPDKWNNARERCELEGAELASPLNTQIHQAMISNMKNVPGVFTGIHSIFSYSDYYSIKGVSLDEMPVNWSYSLSSDINKRCVKLFTDGTITNVNCDSVSLPYICYKKNNYTPLTECGTIDTEYTFNSQLDACYKLHTEVISWHDAFKTCSAEGGHLAVINSDAEFSAVVALFNKDTHAGKDIEYHVLIGISRWQSSIFPQQWITIHGENLVKAGFSTWTPNEPSSNSDFCGGLKRSGLVTIPCYGPFVCEKVPDSLITMYQLYDIKKPIIDI